MTDVNESNDTELTQPPELDLLKKRADLMQIQYHPSIGLEKLREKVAAHLADNDTEQEEEETVVEQTPAPVAQTPAVSTVPSVAALVEAQATQEEAAAVQKAAVPETAGAKRNRLRRESTKLVRVSITCMNPAKKDYSGELFCVGNRNIGSIQRFVPFELETHVEQVILDMIREKQYQAFTKRKVPGTGIVIPEPKFIREFAIHVLDPLTPAELKDLAQRQAMAAGTQE